MLATKMLWVLLVLNTSTGSLEQVEFSTMVNCQNAMLNIMAARGTDVSKVPANLGRYTIANRVGGDVVNIYITCNKR